MDYRKPKVPISKESLDEFSNAFRKATSQPSIKDEEEEMRKKAKEEALKRLRDQKE